MPWMQTDVSHIGPLSIKEIHSPRTSYRDRKTGFLDVIFARMCAPGISSVVKQKSPDFSLEKVFGILLLKNGKNWI